MDSETALRISSSTPVLDDGPSTWTIVLAGGEGLRLADYVQQRFGQRMPKQYCCLLGQRSMLQHTLLRTNQLSPPARTLAVIGTHHASLAMPQLAGVCDHVFCQPSSRDTGVALYVALAMIKRWCPNAIVIVTPADHYVSPAAAYVEAVRTARAVAVRTDRIVILGATATESDPELGYLALGRPLTQVPAAHELAAFVEKPSVAHATALRAEGALWNTMVMCGTVNALWELGRQAEPRLLDIMDSIVPLIGTAYENDAIDCVYQAYLPVNLSRDIMERAPSKLAAIELQGVDWSDWGKSERIEAILALRRSSALGSAPRLDLRGSSRGERR